MLWVKSLHIVFMVTWFAGLFYLPRLFVYHAIAADLASIERFKLMERKLYWGIMTPGAVLTIVFSVWLWLGWFCGGWEVCYAANLWSRIASRTLWRVGQFEYGNENDLYAAVRAIDWPDYFRVERTLRVNVTAQKSPLKSLEFATLRIKDAVCD